MLDALSDEEYVIQRAKTAFKTDPITAKAWMITAKTLYPNNFGVQFEAYQIEKGGGNVKEAARNFSDLIGKFHQQPEFWNEINKVTSSLRSENDGTDHEKQFYCDMFKHIHPDVQHKLLLITAEHCEDTMEHCKLLLLLLQKFSMAIPTHGLGLIETLLSAEKHSHSSNQPINPFRKMLVHDLIPLLNTESVSVDISQKLIFKLLHKAIEYYLYCLNTPNKCQNLDEAWDKLCITLEFSGKKLCWEPYLASFGENWSKEHYWQKLLTFCQSQNLNLDDQNMLKQLLYCVTIFFLNCLNEYKMSLAHSGQTQPCFLLIEAFVDKNLPNPMIALSEPKAKRRKSSDPEIQPHLSVEKSEYKNIVNNFILTKKCWELLNSTDSLQREYNKLNSHLKLNNYLHQFMIDYYIYKGQIDDAFNYIQSSPQESHLNLKLTDSLRLANIMYLKKNYLACYNHILTVLELLPTTTNAGSLTSKLTQGGTRHLHFLPLTRLNVLQYCAKLLIRAISEKSDNNFNDLSIGNIFVLTQLDWPNEEDRIPPLLDVIRQRGSFHYYLFQTYIINVDLLEELTFLFTRQVSLHILPHLEQRRIGTRGADKGVKEEVRQSIKRQVGRCNEALDQLICTFICNEREHLLQSLQ
ncbi:integrator complex subunit 10 [Onthophagus taurus]|uniref:integrator complex subunit 10 n=1 Tax=Onthophagus taurus TaxID=166361 RepID=UPI0039BE46D3